MVKNRKNDSAKALINQEETGCAAKASVTYNCISAKRVYSQFF